MRLLDPDDPRAETLSREQAAATARVDPKLIDKWTERGLLPTVEPGPDGTARYAEPDVLRVEAATRRKPRLQQLATQAVRELDQ